MKTVLFCLFSLGLLSSCQEKKPSYATYQEVIETIIQVDSLDTRHGLSYQLERNDYYFIDTTQKELPPPINAIEVGYLLDKFNSSSRSEDSLYLMNQLRKQCFFVIDKKLTSKFTRQTKHWYSFTDLLFSKSHNKVFGRYTLLCGPSCQFSNEILLEKRNDTWEVIFRKKEQLEY